MSKFAFAFQNNSQFPLKDYGGGGVTKLKAKGGRKKLKRVKQLTREQVSESVEAYLKDGGTITRANLGQREW